MIEKFQWIPNIFDEAATRTATALGEPVYFDYGHYEVVTQNLQDKSASIKMKGMKYPLVWLKMDFPETNDKSPLKPNLVRCSLVFATETESSYTMQQRRDITFLPVLYPLLEKYLEQLGKYNNGFVGGFEKWDHPYWGIKSGADNGGANMFNDYIDAIELRNLELTVLRKIC